jgi:hypothetical protein
MGSFLVGLCRCLWYISLVLLRGTFDHLYSQGRWWFGTRQKTKDGVYTSTAATFFKSLRPESEIDEVVGTLVRGFEWEGTTLRAGNEVLHDLEESIEKSNVVDWVEMKKLAGIAETRDGEGSSRKRRALILLYAHLLRLPVVDSSFQPSPFIRLSSACIVFILIFSPQNKRHFFWKHQFCFLCY